MIVPVPQLRLPPGFRFGTVSSAPQDEGAATEDGRGPSVWDTFSRRPGAVIDGSTPDRGADHYHRLEEDLGLIERLGVRGHQFSISWSRVQPTGRGPVNQAGLDFYDRLVDGLLAVGVEPTAVLYAADLPQALQDDGGWLNRSTCEAFGEYAAVVAERLADRVAHWVPVQNPNSAAYFGYALGSWAPGLRLGLDSAVAAHQLLLGHGRALAALRAAGATSVGCATSHAPVWPLTDDPADVGASKLVDAAWNGFFLEGMLLGRYPADILPLVEDVIAPGDLACIRQPLDFYGVDYHTPLRIAAAPEGADVPFEVAPVVGHPLTDVGWPVVPAALREWLITAPARYRAALPPLVLTACGAAYDAEVGPDGRIDDQLRIDFLAAHLAAVARAVEAGVDIRGFYVDSLLDGWNWEKGYYPRYGLVHVDRETGARTPKESFRWYADLIAAQAAGLAEA